MTAVTVLGQGPMGRALTAALLDAGYRTTVWNRTEANAREMLARGAIWAPSPAEAVAAGGVTLINVVDHDVVDAVLETAGRALAGATVIGLSSDTPDRARQTAELVDGLGGRYLDGAIMTPTDTIGTPDARILLAGPQAVYDTYHPVLDALGTSTWLGEDPGRAAAFDMSLLDLFWTAVSGFEHALMMAAANGIAPRELLPHALGIVDILAPVFIEIAERIEEDRHDDASAPVSSTAASVRHLVNASRDAGVDAGALEAFSGYVDAAVAAGHGADEISRITAEMVQPAAGSPTRKFRWQHV
ncbi:3-hydroxyisobutyrate dehydrogenase [Mycolicibacterium rutilum]|uniref:3-hydroxyisobutyrate dehydrogenase n=1 Tax=Mycolicibacterium rutilum TaxID=370526 RepID=A0A1H6JCA4_MYCRU|nr:NAD(P)-binding domain-containing protein [Mycolicibacterium rutilum]SEH58008.1 3-hydroxyisobutyrate dehydrogenase [Mycolicibacterium rutilum]